MRNVWIIAWNDLRTTLQGNRYWFFLLALPVLVIYLVGLGTQGIAPTLRAALRMDVLDLDDSTASQAFVATLAEANEILLICPAQNDPTDACALAGAALSPALAHERLADQVSVASVTIPPGFAAALERGNPATLVFQPGAGLAAPEIAYAALQNAVTRFGGPIVAARLSTQLAESLGIEAGPGFYAARLADAEASWGPPPPVQVIADTTQSTEEQIVGAQLLENGFKLSAPSIAVMFVMISVLGLTQSLVEDRALGVLRRVGTMPVNKAQWLGGKFLATCLIGLLQFAILLAFGEWLGVGFGRAPLATALVAMVYVLAVTALALALAALTRTPDRASAAATLAWAVLVPLGGGWWPLTFVPEWMQVLGHLSPVAWCLDGLNALIFYGGTLASVLRPVGVLLVFAVVLFVFGAKSLDFHRSGSEDTIRVLPYPRTRRRR